MLSPDDELHGGSVPYSDGLRRDCGCAFIALEDPDQAVLEASDDIVSAGMCHRDLSQRDAFGPECYRDGEGGRGHTAYRMKKSERRKAKRRRKTKKKTQKTKKMRSKRKEGKGE